MGAVPGRVQNVSEHRPDLSVIVPSVNGWSDLQECLEALVAQSGELRIEVIVADRVGEMVRSRLRVRYPGIRLLEFPLATSIPALRAAAFTAARAEIIGVLEDHVIVPPDWGERMIAAHRQGAEVVGGAVENGARERLVDWAAFFCEYSHCLAPPAGSAEWLAGNNVTYRRSLLRRYADAVRQERWENDLHASMRRGGVTLMSRPDIRVKHKKHYTVTEYLFQRYLFARSYAGLRLEKGGRLRKAACGLLALGLPPILFYRIVSGVVKVPGHLTELIRSVPLLMLFVSSWAIGEAVGYWRGPGNSLARVC
jgi:glycosyltransferase involved in cell wall biosynthesis